MVSFLFAAACAYAAEPTTGGWAGLSYKDKQLKYGKWEMRMRLAEGGNMVNCFYLIQYQPVWHEIDVEIRGNATHHVETCVHIFDNETWWKAPWRYSHHPVPGNLAEEYHTYGIEWTPDYISWQLDGYEYRRAESLEDGTMRDRTFSTGGSSIENYMRDTIVAADANYVKEMQHAVMQLDFSLWMGCDSRWCGQWSTANCGKAIFASWFRYFKYQPGQGVDGSDFVLEFADNFDGPEWDLTHWDNPNPGDMVLKDGKAVATMNCRELGTLGSGFHGIVPVDAEDDGDMEVTARGSRNAQVRASTATVTGIAVGEVFDIRGRKVAAMNNDALPAAGKALTKGAYILRCASSSVSAGSRRILVPG